MEESEPTDKEKYLKLLEDTVKTQKREIARLHGELEMEALNQVLEERNKLIASYEKLLGINKADIHKVQGKFKEAAKKD